MTGVTGVIEPSDFIPHGIQCLVPRMPIQVTCKWPCSVVPWKSFQTPERDLLPKIVFGPVDLPELLPEHLRNAADYRGELGIADGQTQD